MRISTDRARLITADATVAGTGCKPVPPNQTLARTEVAVGFPNSTVVERPTGGDAGLRRLAGRILGGGRHRAARHALAATLLPMVRRAVRTGRGPAALVGWLRRNPGTDPDERTLTEDLVCLLLDPPADTLRDSRQAAPAVADPP